MYKFVVNDPYFLPHCGCEIEIELLKGDFITLVGENGVGKSTLLQRFYQQNTSQVSLIEQKPLDFFYDRTLKKIRKIFQDTRASEISQELFTQLWKDFHFAGKEDRYQSSLSGGEGQALKLCLGLSVKREVLFLDEPSQFLDQSAKEALNRVLENFRKSGKTIVMIEHDLSWVKLPSKVYELNIQDGNLQKKKSWTM